MFTGTWNLIKLILRRDRVKLPLWIICVVGSLLLMIPILKSAYGGAELLQTLYVQFGSNPAGLLLTGMMDAPTFGGLFTIETVLWWGLVVAFLNTLLVIRHTRQNEEIGAQELILSCRVSRFSGLAAVLIVAFVTNLVMASLTFIGLSFVPDLKDGALLYSLAMGLFGLTWAVIAAIVAQLTESARGANGMLAGLIGVSFLIRGVGDFLGRPDASGLVRPNWVSSFSPFGWMQATRSLTFPEWWPLLIPVIFIIVVTPVAFFLLSRRDVGAGLLPSKKGRARATKFLRTPLGLTVYLQKNVWIGWTIGISVLMVTIGALVPQMSQVYESSETLKMMIESMGGTGAMIPTFLSAMLMLGVLMILAYTVQALSRIRSEENAGHLENVLATRLGRIKWIFIHLGVVLFGGLMMLVLSGAVLGLAVNLGSEWSVSVWDYIGGALSYFPMVALFAGLYVLCFGIIPQAAGAISWVFYGFVAFMAWLGPMMQLKQWILDLSPLAHIAAAPAETIKVAPLLIIGAAAIAVGLIGLIGWRNRNLTQ